MKHTARILIHHHAIAFNKDGRLWVQSFIGSWAQELAKHFSQVDLLLFESDAKLIQQDYCITANNVILRSLGDVHSKTRYHKIERVRITCNKVSEDYDLLIIRGFTPLQMVVFKSCSIQRKAFLLVGSIKDNNPKFRISLVQFITWFFHKRRLRELQLIALSAVIFVNSPSLNIELKEIYNIDAYFMPTSSISQKDFLPLASRLIGNPLRLLFCGRVIQEKGIEELIMAVALLEKQGLNVRLDVIGKIDADYRLHLKNIENHCDINSQINYLGFIPFGDELLTHYRQADLFLLPSWHEGFPHSVWEAAASCTPVIITPVGGIPGILNNDQVSFCEKSNPQSIVNSILNCVTNYNATSYRTASLYKLASNYTAEKCGEEACNLIMQRTL